ncbi:acetylcholinesterase-1 [Trichonephila inaurata madagascariensis]|uniref:Acetylcholinesterase-1 n=1 Tax=Trichonephila inaurata madagascariensis TaxID=2747483 RepID=A0A8X6YEJ0_9ARAC|nr:acetylcholinesterase-1 [Trichonephila inaurata madagascariensis]
MSGTVTFCVVITLVYSVSCNPVVKIGGSEVFGKNIDFKNFKVNQYLGIPYAQPPVGELRFMPTVPIDEEPRILMPFTSLLLAYNIQRILIPGM